MTQPKPLMEIKGLKTHFFTDEGVVRAVDGVDLEVQPTQTLCVVGESGCGKSVMARSILQIVDSPGKIVAGQILLNHSQEGTIDLAALPPRGQAIRRIRGKEIAMIFQEPMTSLSAHYTIGNQIMEAILLHQRVTQAQARELAIDALRQVGFPKPEERLNAYPFHLSGGLRQRAMIAMALSCHPYLLIADEPTTALDVTTQAIILDLIKELQMRLGMSVMLITHDLGVVAEVADAVAVMYLGMVVERASVFEIFSSPRHPYTQALLRSIPRLGINVRERLNTIRGMVPHPFRRPSGCLFHPRCDYFMPGVCDAAVPPPVRLSNTQEVRCFLCTQAETARAVV